LGNVAALIRDRDDRGVREAEPPVSTEGIECGHEELGAGNELHLAIPEKHTARLNRRLAAAAGGENGHDFQKNVLRQERQAPISAGQAPHG
jgi:hypothetical protein